MHASLRREVQYCLRDNLSRGAGHRTDQGRIWNNIAEKSRRMKVKSPTMAMSDVFEHYEDRLADYNNSFHIIEQQVGALFAIDSRLTGLECFSSSDTFGRFFDKLINSYAMDAIESVDRTAKIPSVQPAKAKVFVESVKKAKGQRHPIVSVGPFFCCFGLKSSSYVKDFVSSLTIQILSLFITGSGPTTSE